MGTLRTALRGGAGVALAFVALAFVAVAAWAEPAPRWRLVTDDPLLGAAVGTQAPDALVAGWEPLGGSYEADDRLMVTAWRRPGAIAVAAERLTGRDSSGRALATVERLWVLTLPAGTDSGDVNVGSGSCALDDVASATGTLMVATRMATVERHSEASDGSYTPDFPGLLVNTASGVGEPVDAARITCVLNYP